MSERKQIKITSKQNPPVPQVEQPLPKEEIQTPPPPKVTIQKRTSPYDNLMEQYEKFQHSHQKFRRMIMAAVAGGLLLIGIGVFFLVRQLNKAHEEKEKVIQNSTQPKSNSVYGFNPNDYHIEQDVIAADVPMVQFLRQLRINDDRILQLLNLPESKQIQAFKQDSKYTLLFDKAEQQKLLYMVYDADPMRYYVLRLDDSLSIKSVDVKVTTQPDIAAFFIDTAMVEVFKNKDINFKIMEKMQQALECRIDFFHLSKGSKCKLLFDKIMGEGKILDIQLNAIYFKTDVQEIYCFRYDNGTEQGYYDIESRPMKSSFLRAPLNYYRLSSKFGKRIDPINPTEVQFHKGTDFAAPVGEPIMTVGDGTVTDMHFSETAGNMVKIKHDNTPYETWYFHTSRYQDGLRVGSRVRQGEVIAFVGMTGERVTGPHVCLRLYKNGESVGLLEENFPMSNPVPTSEAKSFFTTRDSLKAELDKINVYN